MGDVSISKSLKIEKRKLSLVPNSTKSPDLSVRIMSATPNKSVFFKNRKSNLSQFVK